VIERIPYQLCQFFRRYSSAGRPLALVTVLSTEGSTYSKAGSQMLVNDAGDFQGMLSGGCLEGDLALRAKAIMESGIGERVTYDLRGDDDVFGLGVGCEGALDIFIQPLLKENNYEPFRGLLQSLEELNEAEYAAGTGDAHEIITVRAPLRLLLLGAGQDADPLVTFAVALGWYVSVSDHRPAAVARMGECGAATVECVAGTEIAGHFDLGRFDAAIVMSHNLEADRTYLEVLADSSIEFIGLLGPPQRKLRLLDELGASADKLAGRIRGPVGKQIGGRGPAAIALEIAADIQAHFSSSR
jgi:xanthine dehydrogenase accessory factor